MNLGLSYRWNGNLVGIPSLCKRLTTMSQNKSSRRYLFPSKALSYFLKIRWAASKGNNDTICPITFLSFSKKYSSEEQIRLAASMDAPRRSATLRGEISPEVAPVFPRFAISSTSIIVGEPTTIRLENLSKRSSIYCVISPINSSTKVLTASWYMSAAASSKLGKV